MGLANLEGNPTFLEDYPRSIDFTFFHYEDYQSEPGPIVEFLESSRSLDGSLKLAEKFSIVNRGPFRLRHLLPTEANWKKVIKEIRAGMINTLGYHLSLGEGTTITIFCQLFNFTRNIAFSRRRKPDSIHFYTSETTWKERHDIQDLCLRLSHLCWQTMEIVNGHADHFYEDRIGKLTSPDRTTAVTRVLKAFPKSAGAEAAKVDLLKHVDKAGWLSFVNRNVVQALGDYDMLASALAENLPFATIEHIARGGAMVKLNASPLYADTRLWEREHIILAQILSEV